MDESDKKMNNTKTKLSLEISVLIIGISSIFGLLGGIGGYLIARNEAGGSDGIRDILRQDVTVINEDSALIETVESSTEAVVSIVITKDVPIFEQYNPWSDFFSIPEEREEIGTEQQQIGAGTGFIISGDGMVITNRHVADDDEASYTVIFADGSKKEAEIIAQDTLLDIAFLQITEPGEELPFLELGSSQELKVGQNVIAIGNALGEFSNTVSSGIISGLSRNIIASDQSGANSDQLDGLIQTDASINFGNSGGPLIDFSGKVVGVNVAVANNAENIGFAIPIDDVVALLDRLDTESGTIERPVLGVRYRLITASTAEELGVDVENGALIVGEDGGENFAIASGSSAEKAGLQNGDIILEVDGEPVSTDKPLLKLIQNKFVGDEIELLIRRDGENFSVDVTLEASD